MNDNDDAVSDLIRLCEESPLDGLNAIAMFDDELAQKPVILFAKFTAQRRLALARFFSHGHTGYENLSREELHKTFTSAELEQAHAALVTVAAIERIDPNYLPALNTGGDQWALSSIDSVAIPLERLRPGSVQQILGWTKPNYLGTDRIGFVPGLLDAAPPELLRKVLNGRVSSPEVFKSIIVLSWGGTGDDLYLTIQLLKEDYNSTPTVGDAGMLSTLHIYENGRTERSEDGPGDDQEGLHHPNREHLLSEAEMLLRYENDPGRRKYLEQMVEWLNGRGPRPEQRQIESPGDESDDGSSDGNGPAAWQWIAGGILVLCLLSLLF